MLFVNLTEKQSLIIYQKSVNEPQDFQKGKNNTGHNPVGGTITQLSIITLGKCAVSHYFSL